MAIPIDPNPAITANAVFPQSGHSRPEKRPFFHIFPHFSKIELFKRYLPHIGVQYIKLKLMKFSCKCKRNHFVFINMCKSVGLWLWLLALKFGEILREFGEILRDFGEIPGKSRILDGGSIGSKGWQGILIFLKFDMRHGDPPRLHTTTSCIGPQSIRRRDPDRIVSVRLFSHQRNQILNQWGPD